MPNDLSQLKDIHLPSDISNWPIAYGWWLLIILSIVICIASIYAIIQYRKKTAVRNAAIKLLKHHYSQYQESKNQQYFLQKSNQVLKRFCLKAYPHAASLSGLAWTQFLESNSKKSFFNEDTANALSQGIYQKDCHYEPNDLFVACKNWLMHNKSAHSKTTPDKASNSSFNHTTEKQTESSSND